MHGIIIFESFSLTLTRYTLFYHINQLLWDSSICPGEVDSIKKQTIPPPKKRPGCHIVSEANNSVSEASLLSAGAIKICREAQIFC